MEPPCPLAPDGRPPLHAAAELLTESGGSKVLQIFEALLQARADPNSRAGPLGETPLQAVLRRREAEERLDVARALLLHGADPNLSDCSGEGALFEAACEGDTDACDLLLAHGATPVDGGSEEEEEEAPVATPAATTAPPLSVKYVTAQGREWELQQLRSEPSTDAGDSTPSCSEDDAEGPVNGSGTPTREISSYLLASEGTAVSVSLELDEALFPGASELFVDTEAFQLRVAAGHLNLSVRGPSARHAFDSVLWQLKAPVPAGVDAARSTLRLRRGRLTVKLPKLAAAEPTVEEEARAAAAPKQAPVSPAPRATASKAVSPAAMAAVRAYAAVVGSDKAEQFGRKAFPWQAPPRSGGCVRAKLAQELRGSGRGEACSDVQRRCRHCGLPVGALAYAAADGGQMLHGECVAQLRLKELREEERTRVRELRELQRQRHARFGIGWKAASVPRCAPAASKLGLEFAPEGMCCLVYDEEEHALGVLPTLDPLGSVNLEYLSLALQVRACEGREPSFSLDLPAEAPGSPDTWMQKKRFEPEWLAGTSAGEVMFQADYHLKELSMGEYEQPVIGMKSCFDFSEGEDQCREWKAREWFVVRSAEVNLTDGNVLVPSVKMGVEAREQVKGEHGSLEDVPLTRPDHPLVRYAEAFTHNFELIAERKSVIFHLRELAKATVLAKFITETELFLDESWLTLAEQAGDPGPTEIPQLWSERAHARLRVRDGALVHTERQRGFGVYGGVEFGLDRFQLSRPARVAPPTASGMIVQKTTAVSFGLERLRIRPVGKRAPSVVSAPPAVSVPTSVASVVSVPSAVPSAVPSREFVPAHEVPVVRSSRPRSAISAVRPSRPSALRPTEPMPAQPLTAVVQSRLVQRAALVQRPGLFSRPGLQGVDLGLDKFNLSAPSGHVESRGFGDGLDACVSMGAAFWKGLAEGDECAFAEPQRTLFSDVFNPHLSDRREEGDAFVPPVEPATLQSLLQEEAAVRGQRMEHFLGRNFCAEEPGLLFPSSWTSGVGLSRGNSTAAPRALRARPDFKADVGAWEEVLRSAVPVFDKSTEDGMRFRVYSVGKLEVRTTQRPDAKEIVGAVYSLRCMERGSKAPELGARVVKATEYVEGAGADRCRYYLVLETESGHSVLTEKLEDGDVVWEQDPEDLEDRNALAKVLRCADCHDTSVGDVRSLSLVSGPSSRRYVEGVFARAAGEH